MTTIEALKQALEALEDARLHIFLGDKNGIEANIRANYAYESLRQAIAEAEKQSTQENTESIGFYSGRFNGHDLVSLTADIPIGSNLYTHPKECKCNKNS